MFKSNEELDNKLIAMFKESDLSFSKWAQAFRDHLSVVVKPHSQRGSGAGSAWKKEIQTHYAGRGKGWVTTNNEEATILIEAKLDDLASSHPAEVQEYRTLTEAAGFYWLRFKSVTGNPSAPQIKFELRLEGSGHVHGDYFSVAIPQETAKDFPYMGGTPASLNLDTLPDILKTKEPTHQAQVLDDGSSEMVNLFGSSEEEIIEEDVELNVEEDEELEPTEEQLMQEDPEWEQFLADNDLLLEED